MFDYNGYSETQIIALCEQKFVNAGNAEWLHWTAELYSFGKHLRNYAYYPSFLPLYCYLEHGVGAHNSTISPHEQDNDAPVQFYHSQRTVELFRKVSAKPCYSMLSPFVWYRRKNKIKQVSSAQGTLAFPLHTTPDIDLFSSFECYIQDLLQIPEEFQPVCVCLHMHDINKGMHKIFIEHGFPVYTAGNTSDIRFAERFYNILKHFKYTTSSMLGSYVYYSVEMNIPFSLYGAKSILYNKSDPNIPFGIYDFSSLSESYKRSALLFTGWHKKITEEQLAFAEEGLGIKSGISRHKMAQIMYANLIKKQTCLNILSIMAVNCIRCIKKYIKCIILSSTKGKNV